MGNQNDMMQLIEDALHTVHFAVLTTEHDGQPHASLVAITPAGGSRHLLFATYRGTRKYRNLLDNSKVAVFIDGRTLTASDMGEGFVLTALGSAEEIGEPERSAAVNGHVARHPDLESFLRSTDCALFRVTITAYQMVRGIDDVSWLTLDDRADTQDT
jgi:hypothetical protein